MKKALRSVLASLTVVSLGGALCACGGKAENTPTTEAELQKPTSVRYVVEGFEGGPEISKLLLTYEENVTELSKDAFTVKTMSNAREVVDVYQCDENGKKIDASKTFALEFAPKAGAAMFGGATSMQSNPFSYDNATSMNSWSTAKVSASVKVKTDKSFKVGSTVYGGGYSVTKSMDESARVVPQVKSWEKDSYTYKEAGKDDIVLPRAAWAPAGAKEDGGKNPLIIWLHGMGEGGKSCNNDIDIALLGNEVTALTTENKTNIQHYFTTDTQKGAYVLAVQSPTMWMDGGDGGMNNTDTAGKQTSKYTEALFNAIKDYADNNSDIDQNRIYVGGCSNGGYMTMNLAFEHGDYFAAYYPICEAYMNAKISDEMIAQIKDYNIWFLQSEDDTTVNPKQYGVPTFYRLIDAGAQNVHFTFKDHVKGADDPTATYMGHFSWVYAFNDDVKNEFDNSEVKKDFASITITSDGVTSTGSLYVTNANCTKQGNMWDWLSKQSKGK